QLTIRAVADNSGEPIAGVRLHFNGRIGGQREDQTLQTAADGIATFEWEPSSRVEFLWLTASVAGFVPMHLSWGYGNDPRDVKLPPRVDLRFDPGITIGGPVKDAAGRPISGATVDLKLPVTWPAYERFFFSAMDLKTDEMGRWRWDGAP